MVKFGKSKSEQCAKDIIDFLLKNKLWQDTFIYANGKRFGCYDGSNYYYYTEYDDDSANDPWTCVFEENGDFNPRDYFEYCGNFLSMSFEGPLYSILNYYDNMTRCEKIITGLNKIFNKYGYYYELGDAWNLSLYPIH